MIRKIKNGEIELLDDLIEKYYEDIYSYCYRRLHNKDMAQDATQEVFLKFCKSINTYNHVGKCKNYLYIIARNLCINLLKKPECLHLEDIDKAESDSSKIIVNKNYIEDKLNKLPESQKEVIILRFYNDLKIKDIAKITNTNISTAKYRLFQGLKTLKNLFSKEDWF